MWSSKVFLSIAIEGAKLTVSAKISLEYVTAAEAGNYRSLKPWFTVFSQTQLFLLYTWIDPKLEYHKIQLGRAQNKRSKCETACISRFTRYISWLSQFLIVQAQPTWIFRLVAVRTFSSYKEAYAVPSKLRTEINLALVGATLTCSAAAVSRSFANVARFKSFFNNGFAACC